MGGTEERNKNTMNLDMLSTNEILIIMNKEDNNVIKAVNNAIPDIEKTIDVAFNCLSNGGRLIYVGAGTSGRLGVLDASECLPTFGVSNDMVLGIIAGGDNALRNAVESVEDNKEEAKNDLKNIDLKCNDIVIGIAASGKTPYVVGALEYAKEIGAKTSSIVNNPNSSIKKISDITIELLTGEEILTGSTRLKSGTSQKMVLNMISTSLMIRLGKVYENLMVDVKVTNEKLRKRAKNIIKQITNEKEEIIEKVLIDTSWNVKLSIAMILTGKEKEELEKELKNNCGNLRKVINYYKN